MEKIRRIVETIEANREVRTADEHMIGDTLIGDVDRCTEEPNTSTNYFEIVLPEEGILSPEGDLFHHVTIGKLYQDHKDRLIEHGIKVEEKLPFTAEEDDRIRKNWKRFAKKNGFAYEDGRQYAGFMPGFSASSKRRLRKEMIHMIKLRMWPAVCRKLEQRTARQVRNRMLLIMDPHYIGLPTPLSDEEVLLAFSLKSKGESINNIALELKIPFIRLSNILRERTATLNKLGFNRDDALINPQLLQERTVQKDHLYRFYIAVSTALGYSESSFATAITSSPETVEKMMSKFNFAPLIPSFGALNESNLRSSWNRLFKSLLDIYNNQIEKGIEEHLAWSFACNEAMPRLNKSLEIFLIFLRKLKKCVDDEANILAVRYINQTKLGKKLLKHGVIDSLENFSLTGHPYYTKITEMMSQREKFLFNHVEIQLKAKEKLRVLINCYEKLACQSWENSLRYPSVSNTLLVETFIEVIRKIDPDWHPPQKLQRWVRSPELIDLFRRSANESGLSDSLKDIIAFRQMTLSDECSLITLSKSGGVAEALTRKIKSRIGPVEQQAQTKVRRVKKRGWCDEYNESIDWNFQSSHQNRIKVESPRKKLVALSPIPSSPSPTAFEPTPYPTPSATPQAALRPLTIAPHATSSTTELATPFMTPLKIDPTLSKTANSTAPPSPSPSSPNSSVPASPLRANIPNFMLSESSMPTAQTNSQTISQPFPISFGESDNWLDMVMSTNSL